MQSYMFMANLVQLIYFRDI